MERDLYPKRVPFCPQQASLVDQYMWPVKDANSYHCDNGLLGPVYDCRGNLNFTLPLERYPKPWYRIQQELRPPRSCNRK